MKIIGISALYHESASCLFVDGELVAAAAEERFTRIKHDARLPVNAIRYCLAEGRLDITDVDCVAYYESPEKKLGRQLWAGNPSYAPAGMPWVDAQRPIREIREELGYDGRIEQLDHHLSHAAGSFFLSGFDEAAILTVDGVGEWATTTYGRGDGKDVEIFEEVHFPDSIGLLYSTITSYLGFRVLGGEYKVMGLAPYGAPTRVDEMRKLVHLADDGQFTLAPAYFDFIRGRTMYTPALTDLFGMPPRAPESELAQPHMDIARSLQVVLEEILLGKIAYLHARQPSRNLCLSGGVALNCVANGAIARNGPFANVFVPPSPGDAGSCIGAAALAHVRLTGSRPRQRRLEHDYWGPRFGNDEIRLMLDAIGIPALSYVDREDELIDAVVERLVGGKVIGWLHGRMEFGPRALGARSLIADPRVPHMRDHLNRLIKKREGFRPFAPSVLAAHAAEHFELDHASPFMLETCQVRSSLELPSITHVDGSARPQTVEASTSPRYARLLEAFHRRTGCPILINTSFNVRGEPVVCTPLDALRCMLNSQIDTIVLEDHVVDRAMLRSSVEELAMLAHAFRPRGDADAVQTVYTFV